MMRNKMGRIHKLEKSNKKVGIGLRAEQIGTSHHGAQADLGEGHGA